MSHLLNLEGLQGSAVNWAALVAAIFGAMLVVFRVFKAVHFVVVKWMRAWGAAYLHRSRLIEPPPHAHKLDRELARSQAEKSRKLLGKASRLNKLLLWLGDPGIDDLKGAPVINWGDPPDGSNGKTP